MNLGDSEARTGGAEKEAILGDVIEAVIGAIYIDGGLGPAYEFIERLFGEHIGQSGTERADAKTTLQEWAQGRGLEPPLYDEIERTGPDHAPEFTIAVQARRLCAADAPPAHPRRSPSTRPPRPSSCARKSGRERTS